MVTIEVNQIGLEETAVLDGMPMVVVYESPEAAPGKYLGRLWNISMNRSMPTNIAVIKDTLEEVRQAIKIHLVRIDRELKDEKIVEVWI